MKEIWFRFREFSSQNVNSNGGKRVEEVGIDVTGGGGIEGEGIEVEVEEIIVGDIVVEGIEVGGGGEEIGGEEIGIDAVDRDGKMRHCLER